MYRTIGQALQRWVPKHQLFKHGFNVSPMYRRTTGRIVSVSEDLGVVELSIPLSWRNRNYVGTMFGGSMLSATDPILMVQLINLLGDEFVVWDKSVQLRFRRPARTEVKATFSFSEDELEQIRKTCREQGEMELNKEIELRDRAGEVVARGTKTLYVADKAFRAKKQAMRGHA